MLIDKNRRIIHFDDLNLSLEFPRNSTSTKVQLEISTSDASNAPPIPCSFGNIVLSDVIQIEPIGIQFNRPAVLSIQHSAIELPDLASIAIKCYDYTKKDWVTLPLYTGGNLYRS